MNPLKAGQGSSGQVVSILDGDTLEVLDNNRPERIAKQATSELAFGEDVTVNTAGKDRYGRTLGNVTLPDGRSLNHELVKEGWCWWYRKYAPLDTELDALEKDARDAKKGLWADPAPMPPWEFRRTRKTSKRENTHDSKPITGNRQSRLYYPPDCMVYPGSKDYNRILFGSEAEAEAARYVRAGNCP